MRSHWVSVIGAVRGEIGQGIDARWSLRLLARALDARAGVTKISYETVRRTLKNELTSCLRVQRGSRLRMRRLPISNDNWTWTRPRR